MNPKKIFILSLLLSGALLSAHAEEAGDSVTYEFSPHWYLQGAFGYQYTIGETDAGALSSPNAQIAFGYQFTPVWALRLNVNGWQSRAGYKPGTLLSEEQMAQYKIATDGSGLNWKWNYVAPALNVMVDLTNAIGGFKYDRICHVGIYAGVGANIYFNNKEAQAVNQKLKEIYKPLDGGDYMKYLWDGCYTSILGQAGVTIDFRITDNFNMGLECQGNMLNDHYNSKNAQNPDWYINTMLTLTYRIGKTYKKNVIEKPSVVEELPYATVEPKAEVVPEPVPFVQAVKVPQLPILVEVIQNANGTIQLSDEDKNGLTELASYLNNNDKDAIVMIRETPLSNGSTITGIYCVDKTEQDALMVGADLNEVAKAIANSDTKQMLSDLHVAYQNQETNTNAFLENATQDKAKTAQWTNANITQAKANSQEWEDIYFSIGKYYIRENEQSKVQNLVQYLKTNPDAKITISGFADKETGTLIRNYSLSMERAETIKAVLIESGIASKRIFTRAFGGYIQPNNEMVKNRVGICISK